MEKIFSFQLLNIAEKGIKEKEQLWHNKVKQKHRISFTITDVC